MKGYACELPSGLPVCAREKNSHRTLDRQGYHRSSREPERSQFLRDTSFARREHSSQVERWMRSFPRVRPPEMLPKPWLQKGCSACRPRAMAQASLGLSTSDPVHRCGGGDPMDNTVFGCSQARTNTTFAPPDSSRASRSRTVESVPRPAAALHRPATLWTMCTHRPWVREPSVAKMCGIAPLWRMLPNRSLRFPVPGTGGIDLE